MGQLDLEMSDMRWTTTRKILTICTKNRFKEEEDDRSNNPFVDNTDTFVKEEGELNWHLK